MATADGKAPFYKKWWFWLIIVIVIVGVVGAAASGDKDPKKVGESGGSGGSSETTDETGPTVFKVGDVVAVEDQKMTISSVERNWTAEYSTPKEGKEYIRANITLENNGDDKISYYNTFWKIEDADGAIEDAAIVVGNDDNLSYGEIAAGGKKTGSLIFEVPAGETKLKIHYQPTFWTSREVIIEL